jgi:hypothetical protein
MKLKNQLLALLAGCVLVGASVFTYVNYINPDQFNAQSKLPLTEEQKVVILKDYTARVPTIVKNNKSVWEKELKTLYTNAKAKGQTFDPTLVRFASSPINNDYYCTFSNMTWNQVYNCILKQYGPNNDLNVEQYISKYILPRGTDPDVVFDESKQRELDEINKQLAVTANSTSNFATPSQLQARKNALQAQKTAAEARKRRAQSAAALAVESQKIRILMDQIAALTKQIHAAQQTSTRN